MLMHVLEIEQSVAAFSGSALLQILQELVVLCVAVANHFSVDLLLIANVEDHIAMLLILLDLFEDDFAIVGNWKILFLLLLVGMGREKKAKNAIRKFARKFSEIDGTDARFVTEDLPSTPLAIFGL